MPALTPLCVQIRLNVLFGVYGDPGGRARDETMELASRSTTMRRAGAFLALVAFEIGAVVILHRLGELPWLRVPFDDLEGWLRTSAPEDVLAAVVRLIALGAAWWLLGSTALYALARISRVPSAIRALELVTLPSVRRIADQAIALTLATSIMSGGANAAIANPSGIPPRPGSVVASHDPLSTWARASTLSYRPAPGTTDPPGYRPEAAGPAAAAGPSAGQPPGGTPAGAGVDPATTGTAGPSPATSPSRPARAPRLRQAPARPARPRPARRRPARRRPPAAGHRRPPARRAQPVPHRPPAPRRRRPRLPGRRRPSRPPRRHTSRGRQAPARAAPGRRPRRHPGTRPTRPDHRMAGPQPPCRRRHPGRARPACTTWPRATTCGRSPATASPRSAGG